MTVWSYHEKVQNCSRKNRSFHSKNKGKGRGVHPTSTSWKFNLYFVYIFRTDWNFLTKFGSSDPSFNRRILTLLYLKFEAFAHAQIAINHYYILLTSFLTWCELETYIGDTFREMKFANDFINLITRLFPKWILVCKFCTALATSKLVTSKSQL